MTTEDKNMKTNPNAKEKYYEKTKQSNCEKCNFTCFASCCGLSSLFIAERMYKGPIRNTFESQVCQTHWIGDKYYECRCTPSRSGTFAVGLVYILSSKDLKMLPRIINAKYGWGSSGPEERMEVQLAALLSHTPIFLSDENI
ncbi:hypothetical protein ACTXT7_002410 [Hymenolepis weldensis]